jgi:hypothetical protein
MDSTIGCIGWNRRSGHIHEGSDSTGGEPELANTAVMAGNPSQMSTVPSLARTASAITAMAKTTTTITGTSR